MKNKKKLLFALSAMLILGSSSNVSAKTSSKNIPFDGISCVISSTCNYSNATGSVSLGAGDPMIAYVHFDYIDNKGDARGTYIRVTGQGNLSGVTTSATNIRGGQRSNTSVYINGAFHTRVEATY